MEGFHHPGDDVDIACIIFNNPFPVDLNDAINNHGFEILCDENTFKKETKNGSVSDSLHVSEFQELIQSDNDFSKGFVQICPVELLPAGFIPMPIY